MVEIYPEDHRLLVWCCCLVGTSRPVRWFVLVWCGDGAVWRSLRRCFLSQHRGDNAWLVELFLWQSMSAVRLHRVPNPAVQQSHLVAFTPTEMATVTRDSGPSFRDSNSQDVGSSIMQYGWLLLTLAHTVHGHQGIQPECLVLLTGPLFRDSMSPKDVYIDGDLWLLSRSDFHSETWVLVRSAPAGLCIYNVCIYTSLNLWVLQLVD